MIEKDKWTIRAAAQELGLKVCTAKHILYLYRKKGKIYRKKSEKITPVEEDEPIETSQTNFVYVPVPVYVLMYTQPDLVPINLVLNQQG